MQLTLDHRENLRDQRRVGCGKFQSDVETLGVLGLVGQFNECAGEPIQFWEGRP